MNPALPAELSTALEALAEGRSGRDLAARAQSISQLYRSGAPSSQAIRGEDDALAYALTRMPATYAAVSAALAALSDHAPDFAPRTVADIGCGPGTASWAAMEAFESLEAIHFIDGNRALLDLCERLLASAPLQAAETALGSLDAAALPASDLFIAAYVLTEMADGAALNLAARMWAATGGALVIVEPGTPAGWARLMAIRSMLINMKARIVAPCPHHALCPLSPPDWCHFSQRLSRSRAHRLLKDADASYEDEKYAYLAAVRPSVAVIPGMARVLAPPVEDKAAVSLKLCEPTGALELRRIAKRDKAAHRAIRRAGWGDEVEL